MQSVRYKTRGKRIKNVFSESHVEGKWRASFNNVSILSIAQSFRPSPGQEFVIKRLLVMVLTLNPSPKERETN